MTLSAATCTWSKATTPARSHSGDQVMETSLASTGPLSSRHAKRLARTWVSSDPDGCSMVSFSPDIASARAATHRTVSSRPRSHAAPAIKATTTARKAASRGRCRNVFMDAAMEMGIEAARRIAGGGAPV